MIPKKEDRMAAVRKICATETDKLSRERIKSLATEMVKVRIWKLWPQTYDGYSALHTQNSMYLNGGTLSVECESWM